MEGGKNHHLQVLLQHIAGAVFHLEGGTPNNVENKLIINFYTQCQTKLRVKKLLIHTHNIL